MINKMLKSKKAKQTIGISQIIILILGIIAIGWIFGSEVSFVSAEDDCSNPSGSEGEEVCIDGNMRRCQGGSWHAIAGAECAQESDSSNDAGTATLAGVPGTMSLNTPVDGTAGPKGGERPSAGEGGGGESGSGKEGGETSAMSQPGTWGAEKLGTDGTVGLAVGGIIDSAYYGAMAYMGGKMVADLFGADEGVSEAAGYGAGAGIAAHQLLTHENFGGAKWFSDSSIGGWMSNNPGVTSLGVAVIVFAVTYEKTETRTVRINCDSWQPPEGGEHCEECNQGDLPCSEYQCKSLGLGCELENKGTDEETCVWVNRDDVDPPEIKAWEDVLTDEYIYVPDNAVSPPDRGVQIVPEDDKEGCIEAFTRLSFGITTNEPSHCKVDYERKEEFDDMEYNFGGKTTLTYNHTQQLNLPGKDSVESEGNLTLNNDGEYELFIRCKDANGNRNTANFVMSYCVEEGPDETPPEIVDTNIKDGMPIRYNQSDVDVKLYTNEPADCRWSRNDMSYEQMEKEMQCSKSVTEMNAQMLYECHGTLDGLKDREENEFFFRCKDKPQSADEDRNANTESEKFTLIGTQPLVLDSVGPNGTIKDASDPVKVEITAKTSAGYEEGKATCELKEKGEDDSEYTEFKNTGSHEHSQELHLNQGDYEYMIRCKDLGGNTDTKSTKFRVEADNQAPLVSRVFKEDDNLKIMTNEEAECVYDTKNCGYSFDDGASMEDYEGFEHYVEWDINKIYYIKCKDEYDNQPEPDQCNIIARPMDIKEKED